MNNNEPQSASIANRCVEMPLSLIRSSCACLLPFTRRISLYNSANPSAPCRPYRGRLSGTVTAARASTSTRRSGVSVTSSRRRQRVLFSVFAQPGFRTLLLLFAVGPWFGLWIEIMVRF